MKKVLFVLAVVAASCGQPSVQVMQQDGEIESIANPEDLDLNIGDSVIVYNYLSTRSLYENRKIYGFWKGVLPKGSVDSESVLFYQTAVIYRP